MARIIDQKRPNGVTYIVDIDDKILKQGTFQYFALASDTPRVNRCSLFLDLLKYTPRQHNQTHPIHSMQIENIEGGSRVTLKAQPYAFTQEQLETVVKRVHYRIQPEMQSDYPLINEAGLKKDEEAKRQQRGEFEPDAILEKTNPEAYQAQRALYFAFKKILPGVRGHQGDIIYKSNTVDKNHKVLAYHLLTSGACMKCNSSGPATIRGLHQYLSGIIAHKNFSDKLLDYKVGALYLYEENKPEDVAYFVTSQGVYLAGGALISSFSPRPAP